ncbi:MAG: hypothetical protein ACC657_06020 [Thiohalomonadales bacterium]
MLFKNTFTNFFLYFILFLSQISIAIAEVEITPMVGYRIGGDFENSTNSTKLELEETETIGLVVDFDYGKYQQITLLYSQQKTNMITFEPGVTNPLFGVDVEYFHIGGNQIWIKDKMRPFFGATIGGTHFSPEGYNSTTKFSFSIGGGSKFFLTKRIALMIGARGYMTFFSDSSAVFCGPGGCLISISGSAMFQLEANAGLTFRF